MATLQLEQATYRIKGAIYDTYKYVENRVKFQIGRQKSCGISIWSSKNI